MANLGKSGVSVGYYDTQEAAAKAYDRAAISLLGKDNGSISTNFPLKQYQEDQLVCPCFLSSLEGVEYAFSACRSAHVVQLLRVACILQTCCGNSEQHALAAKCAEGSCREGCSALRKGGFWMPDWLAHCRCPSWSARHATRSRQC